MSNVARVNAARSLVHEDSRWSTGEKWEGGGEEVICFRFYEDTISYQRLLDGLSRHLLEDSFMSQIKMTNFVRVRFSNRKSIVIYLRIYSSS